MSLVMKDAHDKAQWDKYVTSHEEANFLQSWQWGEFHKSRGKEVIRRVAYDGNKIVGVYVGQVENARRGKHIEIAGGPIMDWSDDKLVNLVRDDIKNETIKHHAVFARVRPQLELTESNVALFKRLGYRSAPMYLSVEYAGILDLTKSEDEILKGMRQRLRRALRKAAKNHITVEKSTDPEDIKTFYNIQLQTAHRHDFIAFSESFLTKQFKAFAEDGDVVLYTAKYDDKILAQNFMIFYGNEASYHYGVSTELGTKLSGAPLLHMEAMRDARKRGIKRYSFWGIVAENDTKHRFYGVSVFKRGFGVQELKYVHAQDLVVEPLAYIKTWIIETIRRKIRHV